MPLAAADGPRDDQTKRRSDTACDITYTWNLKEDDIDELIYKPEIDSQTQTKG